MFSINYFQIILSITFLNLLIISMPLQAENSEQREKFDIGFTFIHTSLVVGELSTFSGSYELFTAVPVSNNLKIYGILPFTNFSQRTGSKQSYSGIGNLVLGIKYYFGEKMNFLLKGGIALPTIGDDSVSKFANLYSYMSRIYDLEKFATDHTALFTEFQYKYAFDENYFIGAGTGLKLLLWTGSGSNDADLFLPFNVFIGFEKPEIIRVTAAFKGIYYLTNEHGDFDNNLWNLLRLKVSFPLQIIEPGIILETPMNDNYSKWLDYNIGLSILVKIM